MARMKAELGAGGGKAAQLEPGQEGGS
jgi:hypothetical protein